MSLAEKARRLAEQKQRSGDVDWSVERDWWLSSLNDLYRDIGEWLAPLEAEGVLTIERDTISLTEQDIGTYEAPVLVLEFSSAAVVLEPRGTLFIGSFGRVDVFRRGHRGRRSPVLSLSKQNGEPVWTIWSSPDPRDRRPMSKVDFEALVESLL